MQEMFYSMHVETYIVIHGAPEVGVVNRYSCIQHWSNYQPT